MTITQAMPAIGSGSYVLDPSASEAAITARGAFGARVHATIDLVDLQVDVAADPSASRAGQHSTCHRSNREMADATRTFEIASSVSTSTRR